VLNYSKIKIAIGRGRIRTPNHYNQPVWLDDHSTCSICAAVEHVITLFQPKQKNAFIPKGYKAHCARETQVSGYNQAITSVGAIRAGGRYTTLGTRRRQDNSLRYPILVHP